MLSLVLPYSAAVFGKAVVMPNLMPPIRSVEDALAYKQRILDALPPGSTFEPLMTLYLTESTSVSEINTAAEMDDIVGVKLYPAGVTTNSDEGVSDIESIYSTFEAMEKAGLPLLIHGEVVDPEIDIFDREQVFIDKVLEPLRLNFSDLKIVLEHITTTYAVDYVEAGNASLVATITPHHLVINRNDLFKGGIRPHLYCLPIAKRETSRQSLRRAATSGNEKFFLGTDSAPHTVREKESDCGCAGIFNAPTTMQILAEVFDQEQSIDQLEAFTSLNGTNFYALDLEEDIIELEKIDDEPPIANSVGVEAEDMVRVFLPAEARRWKITNAPQLAKTHLSTYSSR